MGVLPGHTFHAAGFTPPVVTVNNGRFEVVRWIYAKSYQNYQDHTSIEKVRESVGEDGSYVRTVLARKITAAVPGARFSLPVFL